MTTSGWETGPVVPDVESKTQRQFIYIQYRQPPLTLEKLPHGRSISVDDIRNPVLFIREKILDIGSDPLPSQDSTYESVVINAEITPETLPQLLGLFREMEREGIRNTILVSQIHSRVIAEINSPRCGNSILHDLHELFGTVRLTLLYDMYGIKRREEVQAFKTALSIGISKMINDPSEIVIRGSIGTLSYGGYRKARKLELPNLDNERYVLFKGIKEFADQNNEAGQCKVLFSSPESLYSRIRDHFASSTYLGQTSDDVKIVRLYQITDYNPNTILHILSLMHG